jgi:hypothetical protein
MFSGSQAGLQVRTEMGQCNSLLEDKSFTPVEGIERERETFAIIKPQEETQEIAYIGEFHGNKEERSELK